MSVELRFVRLAHAPQCDPAALFKWHSNPEVLTTPCYSASAVRDIVGSATESTLNILATRDPAEIIEAAVVLARANQIPGKAICVLCANRLEADHVRAQLLCFPDSRPESEYVVIGGALVVAAVWGVDASATIGSVVIVSSTLADVFHEILVAEGARSTARKAILFHQQPFSLLIKEPH